MHRLFKWIKSEWKWNLYSKDKFQHKLASTLFKAFSDVTLTFKQRKSRFLGMSNLGHAQYRSRRHCCSTFCSKFSEESQKCKKVRDFCYFDCLHVFNARRSIHQGHAKFNKSWERQQAFISLSAFLCDQIWPIYPRRCEEVAWDSVLLQKMLQWNMIIAFLFYFISFGFWDCQHLWWPSFWKESQLKARETGHFKGDDLEQQIMLIGLFKRRSVILP